MPHFYFMLLFAFSFSFLSSPFFVTIPAEAKVSWLNLRPIQPSGQRVSGICPLGLECDKSFESHAEFNHARNETSTPHTSAPSWA